MTQLANTIEPGKNRTERMQMVCDRYLQKVSFAGIYDNLMRAQPAE